MLCRSGLRRGGHWTPAALRVYNVGERVMVHFYRDGEEEEAQLTLGERPQQGLASQRCALCAMGR